VALRQILELLASNPIKANAKSFDSVWCETQAETQCDIHGLASGGCTVSSAHESCQKVYQGLPSPDGLDRERAGEGGFGCTLLGVPASNMFVYVHHEAR